MLVEYLSDIYQCLTVLECQLVLYQTFKSLLLLLQQKNQSSISSLFCWSFPVPVLSKFLQLFVFIRAMFIAYLRGLVLLSQNTIHLHSLSSLTPFVTWLMHYSCSNRYILPSRLTRNAITWLPRDHTEPTHRILGTRLMPENPAWTSYHVMTHDATCVRLTCTSALL